MMRIRLVGALATGFLAALGAASFPASAADTSIATQPNDTWHPSSVSIKVGDTVTWSNADGGFHNVCVQKPGTTTTTCDEFRNGDPAPTWAANPTNAHKFTAPGTYSFYCEAHKSLGMTGTITVESDGTSTTVPPDTQPTDTTTAPAQTAPAPDTTAPSFTGKLKRR